MSILSWQFTFLAPANQRGTSKGGLKVHSKKDAEFHVELQSSTLQVCGADLASFPSQRRGHPFAVLSTAGRSTGDAGRRLNA